jgi:hypothetical protein
MPVFGLQRTLMLQFKIAACPGRQHVGTGQIRLVLGQFVVIDPKEY